MPFYNLVPAVLRPPQVPQLRRNRSLAIARQRPQFPERQPRSAVRRRNHHIANNFPLRTQPPRVILAPLAFNARAHPCRNPHQVRAPERSAPAFLRAPRAASQNIFSSPFIPRAVIIPAVTPCPPIHHSAHRRDLLFPELSALSTQSYFHRTQHCVSTSQCELPKFEFPKIL